MSDSITVEDMLKLQKVLDEANVPEDNRQFHYVGTDGNSYIIKSGMVIPEEWFEVMPDYIKSFYITGGK